MGWLIDRANMKNQSPAGASNGALAMLKINKGPSMIRCVPLNSISFEKPLRFVSLVTFLFS